MTECLNNLNAMNGAEIKNVENSNHVNVLILGGGLAGLGAAYSISKLSKNSMECTYRILEAQNQAGGRVRIEKLLNSKNNFCTVKNHVNDCSNIVDTGAQWLHGSKNILYSISQKNQLLLSEQSEEGVGAYFHENSYQIDSHFVKKVDFYIGQLLNECEEFAFKHTKNEIIPKSVGHFLRKRFQKFIDSLENSQDKKNAYDLFDWHVRFQMIDNSCLSIDQLSAIYWGKYSFNGESCQAHFNFKNCFGSVIDCILNEIEYNSIEYKKEVTEIQIHNNSRANVSVKCIDGSIYTANHVIVTFSLGVLKKIHKTLFKPTLPSHIHLAIESIGFETINKIFLEFHTIWWNDLDGIQFVFNHKREKKQWTDYLTGFDILKPHSSNILLGWVGGIGATQMEKLDDEQIIDDCIKLLSKFTGQSVPYPKRYYCTRWHSNPFVRGGYSYISTKCDSNETISRNILNKSVTLEDFYTDGIDVCNNEDHSLKCDLEMLKKRQNYLNFMHKPSTPIVLFAGEACHDKYFSTAHGAFASGIEQAQKIIDLYK